MKKYNKFKSLNKEITILNKICKECGKFKHIPYVMCMDCFRDMNISINKKDYTYEKIC